MNIEALHKKLVDYCPSGYQINEIITFSYPYRRIRIQATVNKSPEEAIQQIYAVFLRAIEQGYNEERMLIDFLGLYEGDFILKELTILEERGYLSFVNNRWQVEAAGYAFIKDTSLLKVLEEETYTFLLDGISGEVCSAALQGLKDKKISNYLEPINPAPFKSPQILKGKRQQLVDLYEQEQQGKAFLVDYEPQIIYDNDKWKDYYFIEYKAEVDRKEELESFIEVRTINAAFSLDSRLSKLLMERGSSSVI